VTETNLADAREGQIWRAPNGDICLVKDVLNLTSTLLIVFEDFSKPTKETLSFSFADGWEQLSSVEADNSNPEFQLH